MLIEPPKEIVEKIIKKIKIDKSTKEAEIDFFDFSKEEKEYLIKFILFILKKLKRKFFDDYENHSIYEISYKIRNMKEFKILDILHNINIENGNLVCFDGIINSLSQVYKELKIYKYKCMYCDTTIKQVLREDVDDEFIPPKTCQECRKKAVEFIPNHRDTISYSIISAQEYNEKDFKNMNLKTINGKVVGVLSQKLLSELSLGDKVRIYGILSQKENRKPGTQKEKAIYTPYINILSYEKKIETFDEIILTEKDIERIKEMSKNKNLKQNLIDSFAPNIYGYDEIKYSLLMQMVGGSEEKNIHILLIGDPGTAKSSLLEEAYKLAPKSIYTSGRSASTSGLSVITEHSKFYNNEWVYRAGAIVLANQGVLMIDEFNHLSDDNKSVLNQAMEHKMITISKAGGVANFPADTCILAGANPKNERFIKNKSFVSQFNIPEALLTRFSLTFLFIDVVDEKRDKLIASHILSNNNRIGAKYTYDELRKYISYAKKLKPEIPVEIGNMIINYSVGLRQKSKDQLYPITQRYVKKFRDVAIANAKLRLSNKVEKCDVDEMITLFEYMFSLIKSGLGSDELYVENVVMTEKEAQPKIEREEFYDMLVKLNNEYDLITYEDIVERAKETLMMNEIQITDLLKYLIRINRVEMVSKNRYKIVG